MPPISSERYIWPKGKSCAVVFSGDVDGESPFMWYNRGKKVEALAETEQRRFGPRKGVYRILDLLDEFAIKGTFYTPGVTAELYPNLLPDIAVRGHELGFHGFYHELVDKIDVDENARILDRAAKVFEKQLGFTPKGYRSPSWEMTPSVLGLLAERGFRYDSSLMGYDHPYTVNGMAEIPPQWLIDDALYFRYTSGPRDKTHPANPSQVFETWMEEFEGMRELGGLFMITVHPWVSGRAQRIRFLRRVFEHIMACEDVWVTTAMEIADYHIGSQNFDRFQTSARPVDTNF